MFDVKVDVSQLDRFLKESPKRADWALRESLGAAGGSLRKKVIKHIKDGAGWAPLSKKTRDIKRKGNIGAGRVRTDPLELFARLVKFKVGKSKGNLRVQVGFFNTKSWFKSYYGVGAATIARLHETGRKSYKYGKRPIRQMIAPVWRRERSRMTGYVEKKFFKVFFSKRKPSLKI